MDKDKVIGNTDCRKEKDYGYEDGEPCILLKMNRVSGQGCNTENNDCDTCIAGYTNAKVFYNRLLRFSLLCLCFMYVVLYQNRQL